MVHPNSGPTINALRTISIGPRWGSTAETSLLAFEEHPWVAGEFVWTGFDYIGEPTPYDPNMAVRVRRTSASSIWPVFPKIGFIFINRSGPTSRWSICCRIGIGKVGKAKRFPCRHTPMPTRSSCFSTANRRAYARQRIWSACITNGKFPTKPGTLKAVAKKDGKEVATDEVFTAGTPAKLELKADRATIHADGDDLSFRHRARARQRRPHLPQRRQ